MSGSVRLTMIVPAQHLRCSRPLANTLFRCSGSNSGRELAQCTESWVQATRTPDRLSRTAVTTSGLGLSYLLPRPMENTTVLGAMISHNRRENSAISAALALPPWCGKTRMCATGSTLWVTRSSRPISSRSPGKSASGFPFSERRTTALREFVCSLRPCLSVLPGPLAAR